LEKNTAVQGTASALWREKAEAAQRSCAGLGGVRTTSRTETS
jgi:hypothetical protein